MKRTNPRRAAPPAPHENGSKVTPNGAPVSQDETFRLKVGLAEMLKGGVIMDVMNAEQAEVDRKSVV